MIFNRGWISVFLQSLHNIRIFLSPWSRSLFWLFFFPKFRPHVRLWSRSDRLPRVFRPPANSVFLPVPLCSSSANWVSKMIVRFFCFFWSPSEHLLFAFDRSPIAFWSPFDRPRSSSHQPNFEERIFLRKKKNFAPVLLSRFEPGLLIPGVFCRSWSLRCHWVPRRNKELIDLNFYLEGSLTCS